MLQNMNVVQDGAAYTALTDLTREVAVRSAGQETIAGDNIAHAEQPYHDMQTAISAQRKAQSFDPGLTERFIAAQIQRDEQ